MVDLTSIERRYLAFIALPKVLGLVLSELWGRPGLAVLVLGVHVGGAVVNAALYTYIER